jgi:hypothetical protein
LVDINVDQVRMLMSSVSKFYIIKTESFLISLSKVTNALLKKKLICEDEWVTTLDIVLANVVFYSFIKSQEIKESVPSDLRQQVFLLVRPMHQALDAAFQHYEADLQKRSARSGDKPNGYV